MTNSETDGATQRALTLYTSGPGAVLSEAMAGREPVAWYFLAMRCGGRAAMLVHRKVEPKPGEASPLEWAEAAIAAYTRALAEEQHPGGRLTLDEARTNIRVMMICALGAHPELSPILDPPVLLDWLDETASDWFPGLDIDDVIAELARASREDSERLALLACRIRMLAPVARLGYFRDAERAQQWFAREQQLSRPSKEGG